MKLGLILEGGGSRTYFTSGVLDALLEENIIADYVIGTSAGIANAVSYTSGQKGRNLKLAKEFMHDKRYMGFHFLLNPKNKSYFNLKFVFDEIPNQHLPFDFDAFERFQGNIIATVTNVITGKAEYLEMPRWDKSFQHLRATCALPLLFPFIYINGIPYMDGGICAPIPVEEAMKAGCNRNIVILTRERGYEKPSEKVLQLAAKRYRAYPQFADALKMRTIAYNRNLQFIEKLAAQGDVFVISPDTIKGIKRTESRPLKLEQLHNQGYDRLKTVLPQLIDYLNK